MTGLGSALQWEVPAITPTFVSTMALIHGYFQSTFCQLRCRFPSSLVEYFVLGEYATLNVLEAIAVPSAGISSLKLRYMRRWNRLCYWRQLYSHGQNCGGFMGRGGE